MLKQDQGAYSAAPRLLKMKSSGSEIPDFTSMIDAHYSTDRNFKTADFQTGKKVCEP
jgi:hypothetical protein